MLYPCKDYYMGVIHAPHDWEVYETTTVECPGKFEDGGASCGSVVSDAPNDDPGSMALMTPRQEHEALERATKRVLAVA